MKTTSKPEVITLAGIVSGLVFLAGSFLPNECDGRIIVTYFCGEN